MEFTQLGIHGALGISSESYFDTRGTLTRIWDRNTILNNFDLVQSSVVTNPRLGTLRGLHYQTEPFTENKVVECVSGKVFDVIFDLRKNSPTYGEHIGLEIGPSEAYLGLIVPAGCAHGYLTLLPNSTLVYFMDKEFSKANARGILWNDSFVGIKWPMNPEVISERDLSWPILSLE
jgi:dTDP-4-dehydrorhamnose 3,5-epimerase